MLPRSNTMKRLRPLNFGPVAIKEQDPAARARFRRLTDCRRACRQGQRQSACRRLPVRTKQTGCGRSRAQRRSQRGRPPTTIEQMGAIDHHAKPHHQIGRGADRNCDAFKRDLRHLLGQRQRARPATEVRVTQDDRWISSISDNRIAAGLRPALSPIEPAETVVL